MKNSNSVKMIKTITKHCFVINVVENNGRYDSFESTSYVLGNRTYNSYESAIADLQQYVRDNFESSSFVLDGDSYWTSNGAEKDEENFEITLTVREVHELEAITTLRVKC